MITSKQRADLRAQANTLDTTLMVGKNGVSETLIAEAEKLLDARELVKGRVLETAFLTAREASDEICAQTGAEGIQAVGSKFVIYRKSEKLEAERKAKATAAKKPAPKKVNPVKVGIKTRRKAAKEEKERRDKYFHDAAVQAAIERRKQKNQQDF